MIPTDRDETRLAIAMAAGSGLVWKDLPAEDRAAFKKHANSALIFLALPGIQLDAARHLSDRLQGLVESLRVSAEAIESDPASKATEPTIRSLYARATEAERIARVLRGLPEPEEAISVFDPEAPKAADTWPEVWAKVDTEEEEAVG